MWFKNVTPKSVSFYLSQINTEEEICKSCNERIKLKQFKNQQFTPNKIIHTKLQDHVVLQLWLIKGYADITFLA